ncbi:MAG TPA: hypothetical protein VFO20_08245 [Propionibacteriaceae bacterium]|nr:hypothetical protein [Propionibacteriaceae bacterium]
MSAGVRLNGERHRDRRRSLRCDALEAMLIYSMGVSVDGFITDREAAALDATDRYVGLHHESCHDS